MQSADSHCTDHKEEVLYALLRLLIKLPVPACAPSTSWCPLPKAMDKYVKCPQIILLLRTHWPSSLTEQCRAEYSGCQQSQFPLFVVLIDPSERVSGRKDHNCPFINGQKSRMILCSPSPLPVRWEGRKSGKSVNCE